MTTNCRCPMCERDTPACTGMDAVCERCRSREMPDVLAAVIHGLQTDMPGVRITRYEPSPGQGGVHIHLLVPDALVLRLGPVPEDQ